MKPWVLLEAYRAEAEGVRRLQTKPFRSRIAEMLVWLACWIDPGIGIRVRPGFPA